MRIVALVICMVFLLGSVGVFAADTKAAGKEKTVFQIVSDTMAGTPKLSPKNQIKPMKKMDNFQTMSDGIKEGSKKAKELSLRKKKK